MVCKVKMGSYPNFTDGVQWTISGNGDHGMEHNDALESWEITGCENSSVVFYEHGDHNQRQQAHVLTNGKYQRYNESKWINTHGPYASHLNGISAAKIQSPGGESLTKGGKINAIIDIPDGQGPRAQESFTVDNWDNYLKPNQDHNLSGHCPGATWKAWQHAKTADKPAKALCQWKIEENAMSSLAASNKPHVKSVYNAIINRVCNAIKNDTPNFKTGRGNKETCWDLVNTQKFMKEYCFKGNRMSEDPLCSKSSLGASYNILAKQYCDANPDKDFCGCYNVLNNKCLTEKNKDLPGCKVTYPTRESINKMPAEYSSNFEGTDKCWGNVCARGMGKYVPEGTLDALCNKTVAVCIADLDVGNLKESGVNIEQNCGNNNPTTDGSSNEPSGGSTDGTPAPMRTSSAPVTPSSTPTSSSTPASTEELKIYEKPSVQIGTVASSLVSISSCAMLIMLAM